MRVVLYALRDLASTNLLEAFVGLELVGGPLQVDLFLHLRQVWHANRPVDERLQELSVIQQLGRQLVDDGDMRDALAVDRLLQAQHSFAQVVNVEHQLAHRVIVGRRERR